MQKIINYVPRQKNILLQIFTVPTITVNNGVRGTKHLLEQYL